MYKIRNDGFNCIQNPQAAKPKWLCFFCSFTSCPLGAETKFRRQLSMRRYGYPTGFWCGRLEACFYSRHTKTLKCWSRFGISNFGTIYIVCLVVNGRPREPRETTEASSRAQILVPEYKPKSLTTPPGPLKLRLFGAIYKYIDMWYLNTAWAKLKAMAGWLAG